jgi:hypothetical protein
LLCLLFYEAYLSTGRRMQRRKREGEYNVLYRRQLGDKIFQGMRRRKNTGSRRRPEEEEDRKKTGSRTLVEGVSK